MFLRFCLLLVTVLPAAAQEDAVVDKKHLGPPPPMGKMPDKDKDGFYKSKADACSACKYVATTSCAMYNTCMCYVVNANWGAVGLDETTDKHNWRWACNVDNDDNYQLCFNSIWSEQKKIYQDKFGNEVDPNNPRCPL